MDIGSIGFAAAMGLAATGSALGMGAAGMAAIGAWKKCFARGKRAPFMLVAFVGAPLTQALYGMILMNMIEASSAGPITKFGVGLLGGLAMGTSAWFQGKAGASASDALAETGRGFANYILVLGIIESTALLAMIFLGLRL